MKREVENWLNDVQENWYPGYVEGMVSDYIFELRKEITLLRKFQSNEMWRRDQARMGL